MSAKDADATAIVEAIQDLTRVILALNEETTNKSETIRRLSALSIPPARIALLLGMQAKDVTSALAKAKKRTVNDSDQA